MTDALCYKPDFFEIYGRKLKIEYLGMASVYTIIALYFFDVLPSFYQSVIAALGSFFLFLGLKKKTKDHFSGSLILFTSVAIGYGPIAAAGWNIQYLLFGFSVFAMEGYLEKRQYRIYFLPLMFFLWALKDTSWILGFIFVVMYISYPWIEKPGLRRRLVILVLISLLIGIVTSIIRFRSLDTYSLWPLHLHHIWAIDNISIGLLVIMWMLSMSCMTIFSRNSVLPHRLNMIVFCAFSPFDGRLAALFAMVAAVILSATMFREGFYDSRFRPYFKRAEWYFFWIVFAVALGLVLKRPVI